jgi:hypothetical protein
VEPSLGIRPTSNGVVRRTGDGGLSQAFPFTVRSGREQGGDDAGLGVRQCARGSLLTGPRDRTRNLARRRSTVSIPEGARNTLGLKS